jgi:protein disulfide-isomerase A1
MRYKTSLTQRNSIVAYLNRFIHFPVVTEIVSGSLQQFRESNQVVVVGYFSAKHNNERKLFDETAKMLYPEFVFGMCDDSSLAANEDVKTPAVVVYRRGEGRSVFALDGDTRSVSRSIRLAARQDCTKLAPEIHEDILDVSPYT